MIKYRASFIRATCDKCGKIDDYPPFAYDDCDISGKSEIFFKELKEKGWIITADILYSQLDDWDKKTYPSLCRNRRRLRTLDFCCKNCCKKYMWDETFEKDVSPLEVLLNKTKR